MKISRACLIAFGAAFAAFVVACGSSESRSGFAEGAREGQSSPTEPTPGASSGTSGTFNEVDAAPPPPPPPPPPVTVVYGHSATTLFQLDPVTKAVTVVGDFDCSNQVTDLAIDENNAAFVTSFGGFFSLDLATAKCSLIASGSYPNSLSFVPKGTLDPNEEALVGYSGGEYVRIDRTTGGITTIGSIGGGYISSGDIVSVKGGGTFLTALKVGCEDCLLQVDPATGQVVQDYGSLGFGRVYGIAFWGGAVYGFDEYGDLFEINAAGGKLTTTKIPIPNASSALAFWGAGSSTSVPAAAPDGTTFPVK
jgi:hypothetical protein